MREKQKEGIKLEEILPVADMMNLMQRVHDNMISGQIFLEHAAREELENQLKIDEDKLTNVERLVEQETNIQTLIEFFELKNREELLNFLQTKNTIINV